MFVTMLTLSSLVAATGMIFAQRPVADGETPIPRVANTDTFFEKRGAVCIDGSPGGYYFLPATNPKQKHDWQLFFEGGGWCYDKKDCEHRATTTLGSSLEWPAAKGSGGITSSNCTTNPDFCGVNKVYMAYCDGASFSGNLDNSISHNGKRLHFRGRRILDAVLSHLTETFNFGSAENVLLTGCSAGGLAAYLHADYVHEKVSGLSPSLMKYGVAPVSGYFLNTGNVESIPVYPTEIKNIFEMANSTHGVNSDCIAAYPGEEWRCYFADASYTFTHSRTFLLNSALDSWQTKCIFTAELPVFFPHQISNDNGECGMAKGWSNCTDDPNHCSSEQMTVMNGYMREMESSMATGRANYMDGPGNGAFVHSCSTHCEACGSEWNSFMVDNVTMQQALSQWWRSDGFDPTETHLYSACAYSETGSGPRQCNPSCST